MRSGLKHYESLEALRAAIARHHLTQSHLSTALGASQGQLSRALNGETKGRSKLLLQLCDYVFSRDARITDDGVLSEPALLEALRLVWDGTPQHARALATVIKSLGVLRAPR